MGALETAKGRLRKNLILKTVARDACQMEKKILKIQSSPKHFLSELN